MYLAPTKALGHDQLRAAQALTNAVAATCPTSHRAPYDGDSSTDARRFARERSRWIFSNPDMIHLSLLRNHARWAVFLRNLKFVVIDECHYYRGIFGSNVAMVLRRLVRLCERYSGDLGGPTVSLRQRDHVVTGGHRIGAMLGHTVAEVTDDGSPQGGRTVALWEPALRIGRHGRERCSGSALRRLGSGAG